MLSKPKKCIICKANEAVYAWQPELESFYTLGWHERGFMAIPTCDECCGKIKAGQEVRFHYRGLDWWTQGNNLVNMSMNAYH